MKYETIDYTLPAYWASALINGDYSGMADSELETIEWFCLDVIAEHGNAFFSTNDGEPSFITYHDAKYLGVLAADCLTYSILIKV